MALRAAVLVLVAAAGSWPAVALGQEAEEVPEGETPGEESPAEEAPPPPHVAEANERVARGEALFEQGDYDAALAEFERAYEVIGEHPARYLILYNVGQAHERRFRYDLAMQYYRRYLEAGGPGAADRAMVEATIRTLEGLLATVHVAVTVPEAEVWVGDRQVGTAPGDVLVPGGRHVLEVRASGYAPARQEIQIAPRTEQDVAFQLERLAEEYRGLSPIYFWSSAGLAVVALGVGATFGMMAWSEHSDLEGEAADPAQRWLVTDEDNDRVARLALIADISFGAAALFGAGAIILGFLTDWGGELGEEERSARFVPAVGPRDAGLLLRGTF